MTIEGKIKQISFSRGAKVGLPNYSSGDCHISVTVELEEGTPEELDRVMHQARAYVRGQIAKEVKKILEEA